MRLGHKKREREGGGERERERERSGRIMSRYQLKKECVERGSLNLYYNFSKFLDYRIIV
jgi:hypothetical protein